MTIYAHVIEGQVDRVGAPLTGQRWVDEPIYEERPIIVEEPILDDAGEPTGETQEVEQGTEWVDTGETRRVRATVSNFDRLPPEVLREEGWWPIEDGPGPPEPGEGQGVEQELVVEGGRVVRRYRLVDLPEPVPDPIQERVQEARERVGQVQAGPVRDALQAVLDVLDPPTEV